MARNRTVTVRGAGGVDARDFHNVARALRMASPKAARGLREDLRAAGLIVADRAKEIAGEHSQKIPPTVKVRVAGATVAVVAGGKAAPQAGPFELGNTGNRKSAIAGKGTFRHPVFGNREVWVDQDMHPFLAPAAAEAAPEFEAEFVKTLDEVTRTIIFGGKE